MAIPIILGVIAVLFLASFVVEHRRRRRLTNQLAARAERGLGVDGRTAIAASDARAIQGSAGRTG